MSMSSQEETTKQVYGSCIALEHLDVLPEELEKVAGQIMIWTLLDSKSQISREKM